MKFVFFGTDDFSVTVLDELKGAGFLPSLIITIPDKPKGRGLALTPPPTKVWAQKNKIAFLQLEKLDTPSSILLASKIVDFFVVASYGKIIPKAVLDIPKYGTLNVHPSLLPEYRGPSPIESQILNDEKEIGVTIMKMDEKMDHGPIVAQKQLSPYSAPDVDGLPARTTVQSGGQTSGARILRKKLAEMGGKLLAETIPKWVAGEMTAVSQDESKASYTKKFTKKDGELNLIDDPRKNFLKIRAFEDGIGTYFYMKKSTPFPSFSKGGARGGFSEQHTRVKIADASFGNGTLCILRVIPEGRKEIGYDDFLRGL